MELRDDGTIRIPILKLNKTREERENYTATRAYLDEHLIPRRAARRPCDSRSMRMWLRRLQECLDRVMLHVCGQFGEQTGLRRVALAGGVALNCTANGKLMRSGLFDEVYVQPVAGDDGAALGAALHRSSLQRRFRIVGCPLRFLDRTTPPSEIEAALRRFDGRSNGSASILSQPRALPRRS